MKKAKAYAFIVLVLCCCFFSCRKVVNWVFKVGEGDPLAIPIQKYDGRSIRLDGYYYHQYKDGFDVFFLYRNGICNYSFFLAKDLDNLDETIREFDWEKYANHLWDWGAFVIQNNTIKFQRWYPLEFRDQLYLHSGIIINDTTFRITESLLVRDSSYSVENDLYTFRKLEFKPDSINANSPLFPPVRSK